MGVMSHGMYGTRVYRAWSSMKQRCTNPRFVGYARYGGRGIEMCERWATFENFFADMGDVPVGMSLDRIDNDADYKPDNCRWVTAREQANNRGNTRHLTHDGRTQSLCDWARELGVKPALLRSRLVDLHWPVEQALSTPSGARRVQ